MAEKRFDVKTQQLEVIKENGQVVRGLIYRPDADGAFPAAIFSHGFGSNYHEIFKNKHLENSFS